MPEVETEFVEVQILEFTFTSEEDAEDDFGLVQFECRECDVPFERGQSVYLWGEPIGGSLVALLVFGSQECATAHISAFYEDKTDLPLMFVWKVLNG